jgi:hypothetical protein
MKKRRALAASVGGESFRTRRTAGSYSMSRFTMAALAASFLLAATPASATTYNKITVAEFTAVLQSAGFSVSNTSKPDFLSVGGINVWITDCGADGRCAEVCFFDNFSNVHPSAQKVNEWNQTKKIPEASRNSDGTLHMEMWMSMIGATDTNIIDTFKWYQKYRLDNSFWRDQIS